MLGHAVDQRVSGAGVLHKQAPHARRQRAQVTRLRCQIQGAYTHHHGPCQQLRQQHHLGLARDLSAVLAVGLAPAPLPVELQELQPHEHCQGSQLFQRPERRPPHHGHEHGPQGPKRVKQRVRAVQTGGVGHGERLPGLVHQDPRQVHCEEGEQAGVQANEVDHEGVAPPGTHHVHVARGSGHTPRPARGGAQAAAPQVKSRHDRAHCNGLVVEASRHGPHQVARNNGHHHAAGHRRSAVARDFQRQQVGEPGGQDPKERGNVHAHVVQRDPLKGALDGLGSPIEHCCGELQARVNGGANGAAERVPALFVVPREKLGEAVIYQVPSLGTKKTRKSIRLLKKN